MKAGIFPPQGAANVACPYCHAKAGEWCLNQKQSSKPLYTRPHPERAKAWRAYQEKKE